MDNAVLMEIETLRRASLSSLRQKFREVFQEEARTRHREHLFRRIAWRLQTLAEGDLTERARDRAREIAQDADLRKVAPRDFFLIEGKPAAARSTAAAARRIAQPEVERTNDPGGDSGRWVPIREGDVHITQRDCRSSHGHALEWVGLLRIDGVQCEKIIRSDAAANAIALRDLHAEINRGRAGSGIQLARRTT
jgi:hypothetical protein